MNRTSSRTTTKKKKPFNRYSNHVSSIRFSLTFIECIARVQYIENVEERERNVVPFVQATKYCTSKVTAEMKSIRRAKKKIHLIYLEFNFLSPERNPPNPLRYVYGTPFRI